MIQRKPTRLSCFDYNSNGAYFLTICTENRRPILSSIVEETADCELSSVLDYSDPAELVGGDVLDAPRKSNINVKSNAENTTKSVKLLRYGQIVDRHINQLDAFYNNISVDSYVIMPDHIHLILIVSDDREPRVFSTRQHNVVSGFVSTLKRLCNKEIGRNIWQRHFYDHIIRDKEDYEKHLNYIIYNPVHLYYDGLNPEE